MKLILSQINGFYAKFELIMYLLIIMVLSSAYLSFLTQQIETSIAIGVLSSFFTFYHSAFLPKKTKHEQFLLSELQKYSTTMTFYLQAGHNVMKALELSKKNLDPVIQSDIQKTINKLEKEAVLDTEHFKRYNFSAIDIFHQILNIKYQIGGSARDLFTQVNQNVNFEIVQRDKLHRQKNYVKQKLLLMMAITMGLPLLLAFASSELYAGFLSNAMLSTGVTIGLFLLISISLFFVQRNTSDISIYD